MTTRTTDEILYTDSWSGRSSAIEEAAYDAETKTLYVSLNSGGYAYDNVDESTWKGFKNAFSKGRYYAKNIKRDFGPGRVLDWDAFDYAEAREPSAPATGPQTFVTSTAQTYVGAPQAWTLAPNAKVETVTRTFNLQAPILEESLRHTVRFTVGGGTDVKSYSFNAKDVTEAVSEVNEIANMLGQEFKVIEVVTHFE